MLDKSLVNKSKEILFIKVENDGYELAAQRREHSKNDLPLALEAFNAFKQMDDQVNKDIVSFLCHAAIPLEQTNAGSRIKEGHEQKTDRSRMRENKAEIDAAGDDYAANEKDYFDPSTQVKQEPVKVEPKIGRNDPCPCGSGKKYKNCHGK